MEAGSPLWDSESTPGKPRQPQHIIAFLKWSSQYLKCWGYLLQVAFSEDSNRIFLLLWSQALMLNLNLCTASLQLLCQRCFSLRCFIIHGCDWKTTITSSALVLPSQVNPCCKAPSWKTISLFPDPSSCVISFCLCDQKSPGLNARSERTYKTGMRAASSLLDMSLLNNWILLKRHHFFKSCRASFDNIYSCLLFRQFWCDFNLLFKPLSSRLKTLRVAPFQSLYWTLDIRDQLHFLYISNITLLSRWDKNSRHLNYPEKEFFSF